MTLLAAGGLAVAPAAAQAACTSSRTIAAENALPGNGDGEWDISGGSDPDIQGFATNISFQCGDPVQFKVDTPSTSYHLDIYRMGYYGGLGARKVGTVTHTGLQNQPNCNADSATGLTDCGNWGVSATWTVPNDAVSGIYFAHAVRDDAAAPNHSGESHIFFVVRDDSSHSDIDFQTSDTTWQAYNRYGEQGHSLYTGGPLLNPDRAAKVSYNRPFTTRDYSPEDWVFNAEYPMVRWLERNGYDVSYSTGLDNDRPGAAAIIGRHKTFLSVGHDEYWSGDQRKNVEDARAAGVNLAFFSGNEVFWKTRWEDNHRTMVSYKETHANMSNDPTSTWTGTWRDTRGINPEGARPENGLTGTIFTVNSGTTGLAAIEVPAADGKLRFWRNTSVAGQVSGTMSLTPDTLGYEWDEDIDNGARPAGLVELSSATFDVGQKLQDFGSTYGSGTATHHLTLYRAASGALVFGAGTVQWSWGLDNNHDRSSSPVSLSMQQAMVNLMADMHAQPASLQSGLTAATASTDTVGPSTSITAPAAGTRVAPGTVEITGTAADLGGQVGAVEVSVDGGSTWHPATGRQNWQYAWTPLDPGQVTLLSRAADDSGNLGSQTAVTVTVGGMGCPCTLFGDTPLGAASLDNEAVEVGVRFRSDDNGFITALRYYRGAGATGTHTGHLWSNSGTLLGTASFDNNSSPGWHEAALVPAVAVTQNTTYLASFFASNGGYSADAGFFSTPFDAAPLHAPADTGGGPNGAFVYAPAGGFPNTTSGATNYGADVVFARPDQTPPTITTVAPSDGAGAVDPGTRVTARSDEPLAASTVTGATFKLRDGAGTLVPADVSYDAATQTAILRPRAPLAGLITYRATVTGVEDLSHNALAHDRTWTFTTGLPLTGPTLGGESTGSTSIPGGSGKHGSSSSARVGPRVAVTPRTVRASKAGKVTLRVACPLSARSCGLALRLQLGRRTVATMKLTVAGGKTKSVTLKLSRSARRDLLRKRSLKVTAIVAARDKAGHPATTRTSIRLLAPSRR